MALGLVRDYNYGIRCALSQEACRTRGGGPRPWKMQQCMENGLTEIYNAYQVIANKGRMQRGMFTQMKDQLGPDKPLLPETTETNKLLGEVINNLKGMEERLQLLEGK
tara:strand:- start:206 stop:529 length:324 start_codon:yes stop_codon:yes gene_type:complete